MSNLSLWESLEKTDPRHTKDFSGKGGFSGTAINATYIIRKLTETFGPCGRGWKFVIEDERIEDGHLLSTNDRCRLHVVRGHIAYMQDSMWFSTGPQFGQTVLVGENKYGPFTDEEAPKKSITDCIGKCAVLLGIGADVHLGMFDDNKYVSQRLVEEREADGPPIAQSPPLPTPKADMAKKAAIKFAQDSMEFLTKVKTEAALADWRGENSSKVEKLKSYDRELYDDVMLALTDATARTLGT